MKKLMMVAGLLFAQGAMAVTSYSDFNSWISIDSLGLFSGGQSYVAQTPDSVLLANSGSAGFEYLRNVSSSYSSPSYSDIYVPGLGWGYGLESYFHSDFAYQGNNLVVGGVYSLDGYTFNAVSQTEMIGLYSYRWYAPEIDANLAGLSIGLLSGILFLSAERRRATKI